MLRNVRVCVSKREREVDQVRIKEKCWFDAIRNLNTRGRQIQNFLDRFMYTLCIYTAYLCIHIHVCLCTHTYTCSNLCMYIYIFII